MEELPDINFDLSLLDDQEQTEQTIDSFHSRRLQNVLNKDVNLIDTSWLNNYMAFDGNYGNVATKTVPTSDNFSETDSLVGSPAAPSPAISEEGKNFGFVNDDDLLALSVKDLNGLVKQLPKDTVKEIKKRRRTLKNRGYAHSCRLKRLEEKTNLETSKENLERDLDLVKAELMLVTAERDTYKNKYENLLRLLARK